MDLGFLLSARISAGYRNFPDVLRDFVMTMSPGEVVGLVGESGSGKSTVALSLLRLMEFRGGTSRGEVWFKGRNLTTTSEKEMRSLRGREIAMVLQSPLSALNPAMRVGSQIQESWRSHRNVTGDRQSDLLELLAMVNLPAEQSFLDRYPRQISVGQAQRVLIAMAILHRPSLLIADEPASALDAVTQAEILKLLAGLSRQFGMSVLYISHDLLSVASFCHRIDILRQGQIVESNSPEELFRNAQHPYTRTLLASLSFPAFLQDKLSDTGKRNLRLRVEIDKPALENSEVDENDEKLDLCWSAAGREPSPERLFLATERRVIVERAAGGLGGDYPHVIRRRYYEDETQATVAQELGIHQSTVSRYEDLALASLKSVVGSLDRDGRNLRYIPCSQPPRYGGGVFPTMVGQTIHRIITVSINFPPIRDQEFDTDIRCRIPQDVAGALCGIERHGLGARGGEWPTAEWKRANREAWARTGTRWADSEWGESLGSFVPERMASLPGNPQEHERFAEED